MKKYHLKTLGLAVFMGFVAAPILAQENEQQNEQGEQQEIIIRPKAGKDSKVTVEVQEGDVKINGKPLSEFSDENITVRKRSTREGKGRNYGPGSPFRGGVTNFDRKEFFGGDPDKAYLGVLTGKSEHGAKVTSVTKGSAAEKAGLKEGDIITRVGDAKIEGPEDLVAAVGKLKPEQTATITFQRDKKEQKATATLGKRDGQMAYFNTPEFKFDHDLDLNLNDKNMRIFDYFDNGPKLGIRAQDTEDGKGVKVLDVDEGSNAEKAGIEEGDIVTSFDGTEVNSSSALVDAARNAKDKSSIKVKLNRDGKSKEVEVKVPRKLKTATL